MAFPKTLEELKAQGYKFLEHISCRGEHCEAQIEFWETPRGKKMPFDVDAKGNISPHWATCPDAETFR